MKTIKINIKTIEQQKSKQYINFIIKILKNLNFFFKIVNYPTKTKRLTLLKSPHVNKKAMEHFQLKSHKSSILIRMKPLDNSFFYKILILNKPKSVKINVTSH
jgi:ribosomal protein S10